jgi:hypothetical protein
MCVTVTPGSIERTVRVSVSPLGPRSRVDALDDVDPVDEATALIAAALTAGTAVAAAQTVTAAIRA